MRCHNPPICVRSLVLCALAMVLPACATTQERVGTSDFETVIGDWTLTHIADEQVAGALGDSGATLRITPDGAVSGFAGVNRYSGQLDLSEAENGRWRVGPMAVTRMAGPPERMDFESAFLREIETARLFLVIQGELVLDRDGVARLVFAPAQ